MNFKIRHILSFVLVGTLLGACSLEEDPTFPSADVLFSDVEGANTVLNGCYSSVADFNYWGADFHHLTDLGSGMYNTGKDDNLKDIAALNPYSSQNYVENVWKGCYRTIERCNDLISGLNNSDLGEDEVRDLMGQAYFLRAFTYFNLVRLYGKAPLRTEPASSGNVNAALSPASALYEQIIADANLAKEKLNAVRIDGRPTIYAASMLLAKVYMTLAENQTASETEYWQKAYDEAILVYGNFSLVSDYRSLWIEESSNYTSESIFEIAGNVENTLRHLQLFTASNGNLGRSVWGRIKPNIEMYDQHAGAYAGDPRIDATFQTKWDKFNATGKSTPQVTYPVFKGRNNKDKSYPFLAKYFIKNPMALNYNTNMNLVAYRYSDLLIMLAEIENELNGPANAYQYVNEVLDRARNSADSPSTEPADWSGLSQEQFREAIMAEYNFELLGEGHDWFNARRRGYEYFKTHVIDAHNNTSAYDFSKLRDVEYPDNERTMVFPIPATEITSNPNVSASDQNAGY
ncbi:RagB/SusD family nutrient uptake outer membrane protein [Marinifilum fragile]|uniref:RagB/SusD family nutrient uptake outer membrane protein n=1 Tax=Marinifilum fragile TaxID=570161 RepID=UPI002AA757F7|nr:RagB/SusD family nutrient uptake outer membrane protein [Marinifilum fragile]